MEIIQDIAYSCDKLTVLKANEKNKLQINKLHLAKKYMGWD